MSYTGFYINLDRRPDRRTEIESELTSHGIADRYQRFAASDGNSLGLRKSHISEGEMGCATSHYLLLKQNLGDGRHLHVIEDDILLSSRTAPVLDDIIAQNLWAGCDIIYTDIFIPIQTATYKAYKKLYDAAVTRGADGRITGINNFQVIGLQGVPFGSTSSYLVHKDSVAKLHDLYEREITGDPSRSNDLFIRAMNEAGQLKVGCIFPFVTSVRLDHIVETDIARDYHDMSALAAHMARYSFFIDADLDKCEEYIAKFLPLSVTADRHRKILDHLLLFSQTGKYRSF